MSGSTGTLVDILAAVGGTIAAVATLDNPVLSTALPGAASTFGSMVKEIFERRKTAVRDVIISELGAGAFDEIDAAKRDDFVACVLRIFRAAQEGAARRNLRLMASVMREMCVQSCLTADEFLCHADWLATLRREEIIILGHFQKHLKGDDGGWKRLVKFEAGAGTTRKIYDRDLFEKIRHDASVSRIDDDLFIAYCAALTRTGLLIDEAGVDWDGGNCFSTTAIFEKISNYSLFLPVLARDEDETNNSNPKA